ncbi:MAG: DUF3450 family protein [Candidatus Omnitrophica bacterium]|nr:DUF3450 family protein [Candidatus Omnitrophota bacterium]
MKKKAAVGDRRSQTDEFYFAIKHHWRQVGRRWLFLAVVCLSLTSLSAEKPAAGIDETKTALEQWVETQRVISKEKRDLELSKEMLNARIKLVQREIKSLQEKNQEAKNSIAEADQKRAELMDENEKLKQASSSLAGVCVTLEEKMKKLLVRLPDPIRERIKPLSQRLPKEGEKSRLSTAERFQNVVGMLNEIDKFNRDITVTSEVHTLPDGTSFEAAVVYLGISQGYFSASNGAIAGVGFASEEGWVWKPANESAAAIAQTIAILKNEQVASFVQLPIEIQ